MLRMCEKKKKKIFSFKSIFRRKKKSNITKILSKPCKQRPLCQQHKLKWFELSKKKKIIQEKKYKKNNQPKKNFKSKNEK